MVVYAKAFAAGTVAALSSLVTALGDNTVSWQEGLTAAIAFIVGTGIVAAVPNRPPSP